MSEDLGKFVTVKVNNMRKIIKVKLIKCSKCDKKFLCYYYEKEGCSRVNNGSLLKNYTCECENCHPANKKWHPCANQKLNIIFIFR